MLKDEKNLMTDALVASIQQAGAAAVNGAARLFQATYTLGDVGMTMPYAVDGNGAITHLPHLTQAVRDEHNRRHPNRAGRYLFSDLNSLLAWAQRYTTVNTAAFVKSPEGTTEGIATVIIDEMPLQGEDSAPRCLSRCTRGSCRGSRTTSRRWTSRSSPTRSTAPSTSSRRAIW